MILFAGRNSSEDGFCQLLRPGIFISVTTGALPEIPELFSSRIIASDCVQVRACAESDRIVGGEPDRHDTTGKERIMGNDH